MATARPLAPRQPIENSGAASCRRRRWATAARFSAAACLPLLLPCIGSPCTGAELAAPSCVADEETLCLEGGRFRVDSAWETPAGGQGRGRAVRLTGDSGYFWFFGSDNVEVVVKVLNACDFNQRYWVFAAGLTDVEVTLTVTDTATGEARVYLNPLRTAFQPIQDTSAFATCGAATTTRFVDETASRGLASCEDVFGLVAGDYDGDRRDDLYVGCHAEPPRLYRNSGSRFDDRTSELPLRTENEYRDRHVGAFADFDGDGDGDLLVTTGANFGDCCGYDQLYRNDGAAWVDVGDSLGIGDPSGSGRHAIWFDADRDDDLDLFVGHRVYVESPGQNHNLLWLNTPALPWGNGAPDAGLDHLDNHGGGLAVDLDGDLDLELVLAPRCASSAGECAGEPIQELKFYFDTGGSFSRIACAGRNDVVAVAAGDVDHDGDADLVFGRAGAAALLMLNPGGGSPCGWSARDLGAATTNATALALADFDNDGELDLYVGRAALSADAPSALLLGDGAGGFVVDSGAGVTVWRRAGKLEATWVDVERDGWLDLVIGTDTAESPQHLALLVNRYALVRPQNRHLTVHARYDLPGSRNLEAVGARIEARAGTRRWVGWVQTGGSWHGSVPHYVHFGVGDAARVELRVDWPDGTSTTVPDVETGGCWIVGHGSGTADACP